MKNTHTRTLVVLDVDRVVEAMVECEEHTHEAFYGITVLLSRMTHGKSRGVFFFPPSFNARKKKGRVFEMGADKLGRGRVGV